VRYLITGGATGFRPQIKLEAIIDRVSQYLREQRGATRPADFVGAAAPAGSAKAR